MIGKVLFGLRVAGRVVGLVKSLRADTEEEHKELVKEVKAVKHVKSYFLPKSLTWIGGVILIGLGIWRIGAGDEDVGSMLIGNGLVAVGLRGKMERG